MALSFPDPVIGTVKRPAGQGCNSCVHQNYCRVFYWFLRFTDEFPDNYIGVACLSWSNNEADRILTPNADDIEYNTEANDECILIEPRLNEQIGADDDYSS